MVGGSNSGMSKEGVMIIDVEAEEGGDAMNGGDTLLTVHQIAAGLFKAGALDKATMRRFDELCLTPVEHLKAEEIKRLRESSGVSQAVFAKILNVTTSTVGQWERGEKKPTGSALKLLSLVRAKGVGVVL
jgi:putative transcriptional regulator